MNRPITCLINNVSGISIFLLCISMPVPVDGFVKKAKHTTRCGQYWYQGCWTYRTREDFLGTRHSLQSHFINFFCQNSVSILWRIRVYIYIYIYICTYLIAYILYMNYRCYEISLRVKHFYTNWERCEALTGYLSIGRRTGGDWENTWHSGLQSHFPIGSRSIPSYFHVFFRIAFLEGAFISNRIIIVFINYIIIIHINNSSVINNHGRIKNLIVLFKISTGTRKNLFKIYTQFGHAPSKKVR